MDRLALFVEISGLFLFIFCAILFLGKGGGREAFCDSDRCSYLGEDEGQNEEGKHEKLEVNQWHGSRENGKSWIVGHTILRKGECPYKSVFFPPPSPRSDSMGN